MKVFLLLLGAALLSSCVHTSIAPVASPGGVISVIRVPDVKLGDRPRKSQFAKIDEGMYSGFISPEKLDADLPEMGIKQGASEVAVVRIFGDVKTKSGRKFVGYMPVIVVRSPLPLDLTDRAAGKIAAECYRGAKKSFDVYPVTDLVEKPKPKS